MENLGTYKKKLKEIESLISKLDKGELSLTELATLETLTRELHERSIILKYKAFETKVNNDTVSEIVPEEAVEPIDESVIEEPVAEEEQDIEFSIFDSEESPEEPEAIEEELPEPEEAIEEETVEIVEEEEPEIEEEIVVEVKTSSVSVSFLDKLSVADNSVSSQFEGDEIDTLVGAFGLNEKLRFINDLFDGSSEMFSEAIKSLDTQSNLEDARNKAAELASEHSWDPEEESVLEFMSVVNRRYA
jgi:hypothetical protein